MAWNPNFFKAAKWPQQKYSFEVWSNAVTHYIFHNLLFLNLFKEKAVLGVALRFEYLTMCV